MKTHLSKKKLIAWEIWVRSVNQPVFAACLASLRKNALAHPIEVRFVKRPCASGQMASFQNTPFRHRSAIPFRKMRHFFAIFYEENGFVP
jgi:hypothetical protein